MKATKTVYLIGGWMRNSILIRSFSQLMEPSETMSMELEWQRSYFAAAFVGNSLYILGGNDGNGRSVQRFDIKTKQWRTVADMHFERWFVDRLKLNDFKF